MAFFDEGNVERGHFAVTDMKLVCNAAQQQEFENNGAAFYIGLCLFTVSSAQEQLTLRKHQGSNAAKEEAEKCRRGPVAYSLLGRRPNFLCM